MRHCIARAARILVLVPILVAAAAAQVQPNSPLSSLLVNGSSGAVGLPVRSIATVQIGGAPFSRFILFAGAALNPGTPTIVGVLNAVPTTILLNGSVDPGINVGPTGFRTISFEIPAIYTVGAMISVQAAVEDVSSPLGLRLSAPAHITLVSDGIQPDNLFFIPILGSHGTIPVLPAAGTQPGDIPEMDQFGEVGPTTVFDPANFLPVYTPFQSPFNCFVCHGGPPEVFNSYMGTMMANASRDPVFISAFAIACDDMDFLHANGLSPIDRFGVADFCIRCHSPSAWYGGRSGVKGDGVNTPFEMDILDSTLALDPEGIVCEVCHRARDMVPAITPGFSADPTRPENGQLVLSHTTTRHGPFPGTIVTTYPNGVTLYGALQPGTIENLEPNVPNTPIGAGTAVSPAHLTEQHPFITDARLCGSCHNVTQPLTGVSEQRTYTEWENSDFGNPNHPDFQTCQECHMPKTQGQSRSCDLLGFDPTYGFFNKLRQDLPNHKFAGANAWVPQLFQVLYPNVDAQWQSPANYQQLSYFGPASRTQLWQNITNEVLATMARAAEVNLSASETVQGIISADVSIENKTGHKLPTGYPEGRHMWIQLQAFDANGTAFYQSGMLDVNNELIRDNNIKVYEMKMGIELPQIGIPRQESFHLVLNNVIMKDNRIQPKGFVQQKGLGGTDSYDPVLAPYPLGGLYPNNHFIDTTNYTITIPPNTPRPIKVTATVFHQVNSLEYLDFLANGGDSINSTLPHPLAGTIRSMWLGGMPAPAVSVGMVGPSSTPDPMSPHATAMVQIP